MIDYATSRGDDSGDLPLCGRYLVVCANSLSLQVRAYEADAPLPVIWALGALADGETEVLGTWSPLDESRSAWPVAAAELRRRGVEQIRVLVTEKPGAQAPDFPGKPTLVARVDCTPESMSVLGLTARQCRIVERTSLLTEHIRASICRRLSRMGPLGSEADVLELVARSLAQAKRRIETFSGTSSGSSHRPAGQGAPWAIAGQRRVMPIAARGLAR